MTNTLSPPPRRMRMLWIAIALGVSIVLGIVIIAQRSKGPLGRRRILALLEQLENGIGKNDELAWGLKLAKSEPQFQGFAPLFSGALAVQEQRFDDAIDQMALFQPADVARNAGLMVVGQALFGAGRPNEAAAVFRQLIEANPDNIAARFALVRYWHDRGSVSQTMFELDQITRVAPRDHRAWRELGAHSFDFSRYKDAVLYLMSCLECNPPESVTEEIKRELGQCYFHLREYPQAIAILSDLKPNAISLAVQAEAFAAMGEAEKSQNAIQLARELAPADRMVRLVSARLAIQDGHATDAIEGLLLGIKENPNDREFHFQLSQAYALAGEDEKSEAARREFSRIDVLFERYSELNTQVTREPNDIALREELVQICEELGQKRQADSWRRAVAILKQEMELNNSSRDADRK